MLWVIWKSQWTKIICRYVNSYKPLELKLSSPSEPHWFPQLKCSCYLEISWMTPRAFLIKCIPFRGANEKKDCVCQTMWRTVLLSKAASQWAFRRGSREATSSFGESWTRTCMLVGGFVHKKLPARKLSSLNTELSIANRIHSFQVGIHSFFF